MKKFEYTKCRCCGNHNLTKWFSLPSSPVANALFDKPNKEKYPLDLNFCTNCSHLQLDSAPDPDGVFSTYRYKSGVSNFFIKHFETYAKTIFAAENPKTILEIGSNDGYLLEQFKKLGCEVYGVEPSMYLKEDHDKRGVPVITDFFSSKVIEENKWQEKFDVVCANNVLAHIPDTLSVLTDISNSLKEGGVLVAECNDQTGILEGDCLDNVYHEHIDYYSPYSFATLAARVGLVVESIEYIPSHGKSFRAIARKKEGSHEVLLRKTDLRKYKSIVQKYITNRKTRVIEQLKNRNFIAYGAAAKAVTSLYTL
jgi:2-polyprenyl-3-methyl-5-hydroxy-6-metoxy-1,4-benzoquinol methylase